MANDLAIARTVVAGSTDGPVTNEQFPVKSKATKARSVTTFTVPARWFFVENWLPSPVASGRPSYIRSGDANASFLHFSDPRRKKPRRNLVRRTRPVNGSTILLEVPPMRGDSDEVDNRSRTGPRSLPIADPEHFSGGEALSGIAVSHDSTYMLDRSFKLPASYSTDRLCQAMAEGEIVNLGGIWLTFHPDATFFNLDALVTSSSGFSLHSENLMQLAPPAFR